MPGLCIQTHAQASSRTWPDSVSSAKVQIPMQPRAQVLLHIYLFCLTIPQALDGSQGRTLGKTSHKKGCAALKQAAHREGGISIPRHFQDSARLTPWLT